MKCDALPDLIRERAKTLGSIEKASVQWGIKTRTLFLWQAGQRPGVTGIMALSRAWKVAPERVFLAAVHDLIDTQSVSK